MLYNQAKKNLNTKKNITKIKQTKKDQEITLNTDSSKKGLLNVMCIWHL